MFKRGLYQFDPSTNTINKTWLICKKKLTHYTWLNIKKINIFTSVLNCQKEISFGSHIYHPQ